MQAGEDNITIYHGCKMRVVYEITNSDGSVYPLNFWDAKGQIRDKIGGELIANLIVSFNIDYGLIIVELELEDSNAIEAGRYVWDVVLINPDGEPFRYIRGTITKELIATVL